MLAQKIRNRLANDSMTASKYGVDLTSPDSAAQIDRTARNLVRELNFKGHCGGYPNHIEPYTVYSGMCNAEESWGGYRKKDVERVGIVALCASGVVANFFFGGSTTPLLVLGASTCGFTAWTMWN
jgi:hypothetical protein